MTIIKKLNQHIEEWILVTLLIISLTSITLQICMRFIFDNSLAWSEELARYCFVWLIYIGIAYGVKKSRHICLDIVYDLVPVPVKKIMIILSYILIGLFAVVVIYYSYFMIEQIANFGQKSAAMRINMIYVYLSVPVGMVLTLIRVTQNIIRVIKDGDITELQEDELL
ncbi:TRAP-type C4-dicarboxylate transport system, small permease component [Gracilibacillus orientalis]|uniref:TRAP-type C4-dicarboxylate transport system, small permease component n=1 Tax=Gracilibacillus orientalis TaxID=334253 RepID=A0A1I4GVW5_9BACI|nr:TRAP transporter small permease [Gracilibacillus orientalis]SFL33291.1 TRAP-type C4-dicarboxylate transport system, small permease component [Gracilibacillus orientalis]